jgi:pimeloyl-ACP methyl ester carboxylesterase
VAVVAAAVLAGCAAVPPAPPPEPDRPAVALLRGGLEVDGRWLTAEWQVPAAPPTGLVLLQHGFARSCANLRGTARRVAEGGAMTLCLDADMAGGSPSLAQALANALTHGGMTAPDGTPVPARIVVGGHSAGAVFAAGVGRSLAEREPERLAGAVLLDPVATAAFADDLAAVSQAGQRPVRAIMAAAHRCNAHLNALPALRRVADAARDAAGDDLVAVDVGADSTHVDAEGEDTSALAATACGSPRPDRIEALRVLTARWVAEALAGRHVGDEGRRDLDDLLARLRATPLTGLDPR